MHWSCRLGHAVGLCEPAPRPHAGTGMFADAERVDPCIGDRIAEIGKIASKGAREIDAEGHVVCPGFVDGHTHMDAQINWDPIGRNSCWHGITTVVMGNCGFSVAPVRKGEEGFVVRNLERAEDISPDAMAAGMEWKWQSFSEYLDVVDQLPKGINYSAYIGHSALRTWAMGERAFEEEASEEQQQEILQFALDQVSDIGLPETGPQGESATPDATGQP